MKKVFLLLFAALLLASAAGAQEMPATSSEPTAQAGTDINSTTPQHRHRKHKKHHHRVNPN